MLGSVLRPIRSAGYWIEGCVAKFFGWLTRPFRGSTRTSGVEAAVERVAGSLAGRAQGSSRLSVGFENAFGAVLRAITRWRLNYFFAAFFLGAIGYELYLISIATTPSGRDSLLSTLRLTIYFAIVTFSVAHFARSSIQPWLAVWRGWAGVLTRIRALPGAFAACFAVYMAARSISYLPVSWTAGREAQAAIGNFALGFAFYFVLSLVTARIYWKTIRETSTERPTLSMARLLATTLVLWVATAAVKAALSPWAGVVAPRFAIVVFQVFWLAMMLWSAITLFLVPAVVAAAPKPARTALTLAWRHWWTLVVSLILVNFPADIFQVAVSVASPRLPSSLPIRLALDAVSAMVNAVVYFASQAAVLLLFVSAMRARPMTRELGA